MSFPHHSDSGNSPDEGLQLLWKTEGARYNLLSDFVPSKNPALSPCAAQGDLLPQRDMQSCSIHRGNHRTVVKDQLAIWKGLLFCRCLLLRGMAVPVASWKNRRGGGTNVKHFTAPGVRVNQWYCSTVRLWYGQVALSRTEQAHTGKSFWRLSAGPGHHTQQMPAPGVKWWCRQSCTDA